MKTEHIAIEKDDVWIVINKNDGKVIVRGKPFLPLNKIKAEAIADALNILENN